MDQRIRDHEIKAAIGQLIAVADVIREFLIVTLFADTINGTVMSAPSITVPSTVISFGPEYGVRVAPVTCQPTSDDVGKPLNEDTVGVGVGVDVGVGALTTAGGWTNKSTTYR